MEKRRECAHRELVEQEPKDWGRGAAIQEGSLGEPPGSIFLVGMTDSVASATLGCQSELSSGLGFNCFWCCRGAGS